MLEWVKAKWKQLTTKKAPTSFNEELYDRYDVYLPRERLIYSYFNGKELINADPMVLYKKVAAKGEMLNADITASNVPQSKFAGPARERLIKSIQEIFGVKPLEEGGLTELETTELLDSFMVFCEAVKKNSSPTQTQAEETWPSTALPSKEGKDQPTSKPSDSGSTESESTSNHKPPSPSEPCQPSDSSNLDLSSIPPSLTITTQPS